MSPKARVFAATTLGLLALDQATKAVTRATLRPYQDEFEVIPGFLSFVHAQNKGAAMSALADFEHRLWVFGGFTVVAVAVLLYTFRQLRPDERWTAAAIGVLLSGALGNFIDRMAAGQVTDMIKVYAGSGALRTWAIDTFGTATYPIFNVADIAIWVGVGMYVLGFFFERDEEVAAGPPSELGPPPEMV